MSQKVMQLMCALAKPYRYIYLVGIGFVLCAFALHPTLGWLYLAGIMCVLMFMAGEILRRPSAWYRSMQRQHSDVGLVAALWLFGWPAAVLWVAWHCFFDHNRYER